MTKNEINMLRSSIKEAKKTTMTIIKLIIRKIDSKIEKVIDIKGMTIRIPSIEVIDEVVDTDINLIRSINNRISENTT